MSNIVSMANVDGLITPAADARISILDRGFLYGDSVYEVFRTYRGVPLFLDEHFERLENSAKLISMRITQSRALLTDEISRTIAQTGVRPDQDVYVRYSITRGVGAIDLMPDENTASSYVIVVRALMQWDPANYSDGVVAAVTSVRRNAPESLDPNIKGGNYLNNVLGVIDANKLGAREAVFLNLRGTVAEASNSNIWFVIDGKLVTPFPAAGNLLGLTKRGLHEALGRENIPREERDIGAQELSSATECFLSSATREVMPVRRLLLETGQWREFPAGGGDMTRAAMQAYRNYIADYVDQHRDLRLIADVSISEAPEH